MHMLFFMLSCLIFQIAFCYIYLIDDGETLIWGGKRTHEEFRGQGHFGVFIDTLENYARRQHPAVKSWAYTALWINYQKTYIASLEQAGALRKVVTRVSASVLHFCTLCHRIWFEACQEKYAYSYFFYKHDSDYISHLCRNFRTYFFLHIFIELFCKDFSLIRINCIYFILMNGEKKLRNNSVNKCRKNSF